MLKRVKWMGAIALVSVLGLVGCREEPEGWTPVLEQTSTTFLQTHTERALEMTRAARRSLPDEPERAIAELDEVSGVLEELLEFYLPIFEARELTYNAYRELYLGRPRESGRILDEVESILGQVAKRDPRYYRAVETPLEHVEKAQLALDVGSPEARDALNTLASELNFLVLKGELVLTEG